MAKKLNFGMLGAFTPSGSNTSKPGLGTPKPGTGGSRLVDQIRSGSGMKLSQARPTQKKKKVKR